MTNRVGVVIWLYTTCAIPFSAAVYLKETQKKSCQVQMRSPLDHVQFLRILNSRRQNAHYFLIFPRQIKEVDLALDSLDRVDACKNLRRLRDVHYRETRRQTELHPVHNVCFLYFERGER